MTSEEKELLKATVINNISDLEKELESMKDTVQPIAPDDAIGRVSRMDAINNQAVAKAAYGDKQTLLSRLKLSLSVIDKENYGTCAKCKNQIPIKRLMSIPYSNLCVHCAARY